MEWTQTEKGKPKEANQVAQAPQGQVQGGQATQGQKKVHISDLSIQQLQNVGSKYQ